jgi:5S rRNA maturation endonuclease (ribonuclease M5)
MAARLAQLDTVPCIVLPWRKDANHERFMQLLRECNRQRIKTNAEITREEILSTDPENAYRALLEHRTKAAMEAAGGNIELRDCKQRARISQAKIPFLNAVISIINDLGNFWPLSDRQIHYRLLNNPPKIHASKPGSVYRNNKPSYQALTDLLTRARLEGHIPMNCIEDVTRPGSEWRIFDAAQGFVREELDEMFRGYRRNLLQSQSCHIEIIGEKLTIQSAISPIAGQFGIPMTIARGYCSLAPRARIFERFKESGKDRLVLLILSDFDPDGEEIAKSFVHSLRDDFGVDEDDIIAKKVGLTYEQVQELHLPPSMKAKSSSSNCEKFVQQFGTNVFELEAVPPKTLQGFLTEAINSVLDIDAFNVELDAEKRDAAFLEGVRRHVCESLRGLPDIDFGEAKT